LPCPDGLLLLLLLLWRLHHPAKWQPPVDRWTRRLTVLRQVLHWLQWPRLQSVQHCSAVVLSPLSLLLLPLHPAGLGPQLPLLLLLLLLLHQG
jgi:hypothetical protein